MKGDTKLMTSIQSLDEIIDKYSFNVGLNDFEIEAGKQAILQWIADEVLAE